ncbi:hypothetical protein [Rhodoferax sp. PAMC 29310]|uniref:hypothetical protein n=1 Tax=Rhodoferax sp. PAMC 29310 TaxID=2822760 RepID=UPI001B326C28|nr:hypothetical protein [Rhodoferax sp. PAMC 29310]
MTVLSVYALRGNDFIARQAIAKVLLELRLDTAMRDLSRGTHNILAHDLSGSALLVGFRSVLEDIERQFEKNILTPEQAQAILFDLFRAFAHAPRWNSSIPQEFASNVVPDALKSIYLGSVLSEPYRLRDSDGDDVVDLDELLTTRDPLLNDRIRRAGEMKTAKRLRDELEASVLDPKMDKPVHGATHRTYIGDQGTRYGKSTGGYIFFKPVPAGDRGQIKIPSRLTLDRRNAVSIKVYDETRSGGLGLVFDQRVAAVVKGGGRLRFFRGMKPSESFNPERDERIGNRSFTPLQGGAADGLLGDLAVAFDHAFATANTGRARLSPEDYNNRVRQFNVVRRAQVEAISVRLDKATKTRVAELERSIDQATKSLATYSDIVSEDASLITGSLSLGLLEMEIGADGSVALELAQGDLSASEFASIRRTFDGSVKAFNVEFSEDSRALATRVALWNKVMEEYYQFIDSEEFLSYLEALESPERCREYATVAVRLLNSEAGVRFAAQLRAESQRPRSRKRSTLASMVINEPIPRSAEVEASLAVVGQVAAVLLKVASVEVRLELYLRIVDGHQRTGDELRLTQQVIHQLLMAVQRTEDAGIMSDSERFAFYVKQLEAAFDALASTKVKPAVLAQILGKFGSMLQDAQYLQHAEARRVSLLQYDARQKIARRSPTPRLQSYRLVETKPVWGQQVIMAGAAGFSLLSFGIRVRHLFKEPSDTATIVGTVLEGSGLALTLISAADSFLPFVPLKDYAYVAKTKSSSVLLRFVRIGGPVVGVASLVLEGLLVGAKTSKSGKRKASARLLLSGGMLVGGLVYGSNPIGWAILIGGTAAQMWIGSTSATFEQATSELRKLSAY